jgi:hypothetical protein
VKPGNESIKIGRRHAVVPVLRTRASISTVKSYTKARKPLYLAPPAPVALVIFLSQFGIDGVSRVFKEKGRSPKSDTCSDLLTASDRAGRADNTAGK